MAISTQINSPVEYMKSTFTLTSANIKGMYAAPVLVLPAKGPNTIIVIHDAFYELVYTAPAYTGADGNGTIILQYGDTIHAGSPNPALYSGSILSNTSSQVLPVIAINLNLTGAITGIINTGIYASNTTSAYATGNGLINMTLFYSIINTIA